MSMLNRRTQPLDPAVLQSLTQATPQQSQAASPARLTTPLKQPEALIDSLAPVSAKRNDVPAQAPSISGMLSAPPATTASSAAPAAPAAPALNTRLSENEAELLLDVSSKLADIRQQDPAAFAEIMAALQALSTNATGQVDFAALSPRQQELMNTLGMTPQNTKVIFQQLYHLLLPESQQETSQAFKKVQAHVTSFISNLDLRERTVSQIQNQARDLAAVQGVVSSLSAGSITDLLADQTASVYDLSVSRINSQNFQIKNGMDYTLSHMFVLSQQSPQMLQQVEGLIQKVKQEKTLDATETSLLKRYGLDINSENKLQTLDGNILDFQAVSHLENVLYSMQDPSEGYSKVMQATAAVIAQSGQLEKLNLFAREQTAVVQQTTQEVKATTQNLEQIRQDANQIDAQLKFAQFKANHLSTALDAASGLFGPANIDPTVLSQWQVKMVPSAQGMRYFIAEKEVSYQEITAHIGGLLQQQQQEISAKANELARKKTEALTTTAQLGATTEKLEDQKTELKATEQIIVQETAKLKLLEDQRQQVVAAEMPNLKPEEKVIVETVINPMIKERVETVIKESEAVRAEITVAVTQAEVAIIQSRAVQAAVASDAQTWTEHLDEAAKSLDHIAKQLAELPKAEKKPVAESDARPAPETDFSEAGLAPQPAARKSQTAGLDAEAPEVRAQLRRQEQAQASKRLENSFLEQTQRQRFLDNNAQLLDREQDRAVSDRQRLQQEVKEITRD